MPRESLKSCVLLLAALLQGASAERAETASVPSKYRAGAPLLQERSADSPGPAPSTPLAEGAPMALSDEGKLAPAEHLTVTASRSPQPLLQIPGAVDVIDRQTIEAQHWDGVVEALRHLEGIYVEQPGARGSRADIYMRGLDPNHTLVMIDGIAVNDPTNARGGSFDLSTLGTDGIERIEVVRGPLSAVHGSDALAGAINIVTRRAGETPRSTIDVAGGRFGYYSIKGEASGPVGPGGISVVGSWMDDGVPSELGSYRGGEFFATGQMPIFPTGEAGELRATLRFVGADSAAYPEFSGGPEYAILKGQFEHRQLEELDLGLVGESELADSLLGGIDGAVWLTSTQRWEERSSPGVPPEVPAEPGTNDRYQSYTLSSQATAHPWALLDVTGGADVSYEEGKSEGDLVYGGATIPGAADYRLSRAVGGPFLEGLLRPGAGFMLQGGLRVDIPEAASTEVTPRFVGSWAAGETGLTCAASWGKGFKLPSFYALANPLVGNKDLQPERGTGYDAGVEWSLADGRAELSATWFEIDVDDLIDFDLQTFRLQNLRRVESRGVEFGARGRPIEAVELSAFATWNEVANVDSSVPLLNRPKWVGGVALLWEPFAGVRTRLEALFVSTTLDASVPTGVEPVPLAGYALLDLAVSWQAFDWLETYIAIDNLTNSRYQQAVGLPSVGIMPRAGLIARFG